MAQTPYPSHSHSHSQSTVNSSSWLSIGDVVLISDPSEAIGVVRHIDNASFMIGIELTDPLGTSDGVYDVDGIEYFKCRPKYGIFKSVSDIVRLVSPEELLHKIVVLNRALFHKHTKLNKKIQSNRKLKQENISLKQSLSIYQHNEQNLRQEIRELKDQNPILPPPQKLNDGHSNKHRTSFLIDSSPSNSDNDTYLPTKNIKQHPPKLSDDLLNEIRGAPNSKYNKNRKRKISKNKTKTKTSYHRTSKSDIITNSYKPNQNNSFHQYSQSMTESGVHFEENGVDLSELDIDIDIVSNQPQLSSNGHSQLSIHTTSSSSRDGRESEIIQSPPVMNLEASIEIYEPRKSASYQRCKSCNTMENIEEEEQERDEDDEKMCTLTKSKSSHFIELDDDDHILDQLTISTSNSSSHSTSTQKPDPLDIHHSSSDSRSQSQQDIVINNDNGLLSVKRRLSTISHEAIRTKSCPPTRRGSISKEHPQQLINSGKVSITSMTVQPRDDIHDNDLTSNEGKHDNISDDELDDNDFVTMSHKFNFNNSKLNGININAIPMTTIPRKRFSRSTPTSPRDYTHAFDFDDGGKRDINDKRPLLKLNTMSNVIHPKSPMIHFSVKRQSTFNFGSKRLHRKGDLSGNIRSNSSKTELKSTSVWRKNREDFLKQMDKKLEEVMKKYEAKNTTTSTPSRGSSSIVGKTISLKFNKSPLMRKRASYYHGSNLELKANL